MKEKIINALIWVAIFAIAALWTWALESMSPGAPFQAFLASLIILTPATIGIIIGLLAIIVKLNQGEPIWQWQEPKPRKLPLWYRLLNKFL